MSAPMSREMRILTYRFCTATPLRVPCHTTYTISKRLLQCTAVNYKQTKASGEPKINRMLDKLIVKKAGGKR